MQFTAHTFVYKPMSINACIHKHKQILKYRVLGDDDGDVIAGMAHEGQHVCAGLHGANKSTPTRVCGSIHATPLDYAKHGACMDLTAVSSCPTMSSKSEIKDGGFLRSRQCRSQQSRPCQGVDAPKHQIICMYVCMYESMYMCMLVCSICMHVCMYV
jgi:hypothetical protein